MSSSFNPSSIEHLNIFFPGNLEFKIERKGEWIKAEKGIDNLSKALRRGYEDASEKVAKKLIRVIKNAIHYGKPPGGGSWVPLSPATLKKYSKNYPGSITPYQRSGRFADAIDFYQEENGKRMYVGVSQYTNYTSNEGLTAVQLAKLLEFGGGSPDRLIPARPLFNPALKAIGDKPYIRKTILEELRKQATSLGFKYVRIR